MPAKSARSVLKWSTSKDPKSQGSPYLIAFACLDRYSPKAASVHELRFGRCPKHCLKSHVLQSPEHCAMTESSQ
eukprot:613217-Amphidinium_carterae.1